MRVIILVASVVCCFAANDPTLLQLGVDVANTRADADRTGMKTSCPPLSDMCFPPPSSELHVRSAINISKHDDLTLLNGNMSRALFVSHYGQPVRLEPNLVRVCKLYRELYQGAVEEHYKGNALNNMLSLMNGTAGSEIHVDMDAAGSAKYCCYNMLPPYGYLPVEAGGHASSQESPLVFVVVTLFGAMHNRYHEGILQMAETMPLARRNLDIRLIVFYANDVPEELIRTLSTFRDWVILVPCNRPSDWKILVERFFWQDAQALAPGANAYVRSIGMPDLVVTWDTDSLVAAPGFVWFVRHALNLPQFIIAGRGLSGQTGPHGFSRVVDAGCFAFAPKRVPKGWRWPDFPGHRGDGSIRSFAESFLQQVHFGDGQYGNAASREDMYGIDEEILALLMNEVIARDGPHSVYFLDRSTSSALIDATTNTGELVEDLVGMWIVDTSTVLIHENETSARTWRRTGRDTKMMSSLKAPAEI